MTTLSENKTDKAYTLVIRGEVTLNWDDLDFLRSALNTVPSTRSTYIHYNDDGLCEYDACGPVPGRRVDHDYV